MNELQRILDLAPENIEEYVNNRISFLDSQVLKNTYGGKDSAYCVNGWVNSKTLFLPSGMRKKSFNIDSKKLYVEFIKFLQEYLKELDLTTDNIKEFMVLTTHVYLIEMFDTGNELNEDLRNKIFGANNLGDILNKPVNVEELIGQGVVRCIEKSAIINNLLSFIDLDSSIILCNVKLKAIETGHAFCVVKADNNYILFDPSFFTKAINGNVYPLIVTVSETTLATDNITIDISELGETDGNKAIPDQGTLEYEFPGEEYCATHNIVRKAL